MSNEDILAEAIRLIKSGKREDARAILEPLLQRKPDYIQAWMWLAEVFPNDSDKIRVLGNCLKSNPGNPQVLQALNILKNRAASAAPPPQKPAPPVVSPFTTSPFDEAPSSSSSPFTAAPPVKPPPFATPPPSANKPPPPVSSTSPFTTTSPFVTDADQQKKPPQETAEAQPPAAPEKKPARKRSKTVNILIIAGVCVVLILLITGYGLGGFYQSNQIEQAFAAQQCDQVVQHSAFISLYPKAIFSGIFSGYDEYNQCRLNLIMNLMVDEKKWGAALGFAQEYLSTYPQGVFAADTNKQAVFIYSAWATELNDNGDYAGSIDKWQLLVASYPDDPIVADAQAKILQAYLAWSKQLADNKSYSTAEQKLKSAITYFETDTARVEQIKEELVGVYISWGDEQVAAGNLDNAIKYYQQAGEVSQGATDVDLLIAKAYLKQTLDVAARNDFDKALVKVKEIRDAAQSDKVKAEADATREQILALYAASTAPQATSQMAAASASICNGQKPELPIFGVNPDKVRFEFVNSLNQQLPSDWAAATPGEMRYVACSVEQETEVETCQYAGGTLTRLRYEWKIDVYDITSGEVRASQTLPGSDPPECTTTSGKKKSYGNRPTVDQIVIWLQSLGIRK